MISLQKSFWLGVTVLVGSSAARAQTAVPASGVCADRERFGAFFDEALKSAAKGVNYDDINSRAEAVYKIQDAIHKVCPGLPWDLIERVSEGIAFEDMAVKVGTTGRYIFEEATRQYKSAAQNAISLCKGGSVIDLTQCLVVNTCRDTGHNSCLCMSPQEKEQHMNICR